MPGRLSPFARRPNAPQVLEISRTMLEKEGFTVLAAGHPEEALRLARLHQGSLALLLTDVVMPDMNGRQLAEQLCRRALFSVIRCVKKP